MKQQQKTTEGTAAQPVREGIISHEKFVQVLDSITNTYEVFGVAEGEPLADLFQNKKIKIRGPNESIKSFFLPQRESLFYYKSGNIKTDNIRLWYNLPIWCILIVDIKLVSMA